MKRNFVIAALFALSFVVPNASFGQYAEQALQLSNLSYGGTARFTGMGGAFGAIGGDFTTLSINPAGIGVYKNSEFSFTPLVYNTRSFSQYFDNHQQEFTTRININNAGFIFAANTNGDLKAIQFGLGYNRLANFNNSIYFEGFNNNTSFVGSLAPIANQAYKNNDYNINYPFYVDELAGAVNLLYQNSNKEWIADKYDNVSQSVWLRQEGGIDEMVFTFGGNYTDKLYFGMTMGIPIMTYRHTYQYDEWDLYDTRVPFKSMRYEEIYESNASGINGKFGMIFKPISFLRIGAAIHTPTYYWLIQESEWMTMSSAFKDSTQWNRTMSTPERQFEYSQTTPMRLIGSLAFVAGQIAIISADYEWVDHSMNTLRPSRENAMSESNREIRDFYKSQHIVRAGAEFRLSNFYLRGGYGWYSSPFQDEKLNDMSLNTWSLGAGFRAGAFGLDFAYQNARSKSKYYPYAADPSPFANMTNNANSYIMTLSYRY